MLLPVIDIVNQQVGDANLKEKIELYLDESITEKIEESDIIKLENIAMIQSDEWFALRLKSLAGMIRFSLEIKERKEGKKGEKSFKKLTI
ncbi:MAG: hypothetical protein IPL95_16890 [Saprospiraceae bacterium]|nr:hypothetical protein [Saprospiraceae bacterium]